MAGIAGAIGPEAWDARPLLDAMAASLRFSPQSREERWADTRAGLCRVRNGADGSPPQPVFSRDRTKYIVMFGECFDYEARKRELARRGHAFEFVDSDAEFCLRLYEEHGRSAFALLSGSFSLAIHDASSGELLLVNDRLGSRPLFYALTDRGGLVFSTLASAVLRSPEVSRALDVRAVVEFCSLQRVLGDRTHHLGVKTLPPASVLEFKHGRATIGPYWRPDYRPRAGSLSSYAEELAQTVKRAMGQVMRGPSPVGLLLSGGLDARMMVAAAEAELACYAFGDFENPEVQTARAVADAKGFKLRFLQRDPDHYANVVDAAVELGGGMHPFNHAHALGFVEEIARECPVLTHGYGIEALFRGTTLPRRPREFLGLTWGERLDPSLDGRTLPHRMYRRAYSLLGRYPELFAPGLAERVEEEVLDCASQLAADSSGHCASVYDQLLWSDVFARARYPSYVFLPSLRPYVLERSVLFSNAVIDLHLETPVELRFGNRLWLEAMAILDRDVARVVNANTGFSPFLSPALVSGVEAGRKAMEKVPLLWRLATRPGRGEPGPGLSTGSWSRFDWLIRHNGKLRQLISDTLGDPQALPSQVFDLEGVQAVLAEHLSGQGHHRAVLFALLTFGRWHKKYGAC